MARTLGRELYDRGWRQGSIIPAAAHVPHLDSLDPARWETASPRDPTLVLVTQACDLVKSEVKLPYLEAIACFKDVPLSRSVRLNDSRYFVLSRDAALVADRAHVVLLTRESLAAIPSPAEVPLATEIERRRFARWLGARYDRPALPDEIHPALTIPLGEAFARYCKPGQRLEWLNDHLHEVRVAGPLDQPPPWDVALLFVLASDAPLDECKLAIAEVLAEAGILLLVDGDPPGSAIRVTEWVAVPANRLPVTTYWGSAPLAMDMMSIAGDDAFGAQPLRAEAG